LVLDPQKTDWISQLTTFKPDAVVNALHGNLGEDGIVQGVLELLRIPYTHCGVLASAVAMDKEISKALFRDSGLPTPKGSVFSWHDVAQGDPLPRPFVLKPIHEGSSVGVHIVTPETDLAILRKTWHFGERFLLEEYIPGRELVVSVLNDCALGVMEIIPKQSMFYDYETKYTDGLAEHIVDAKIPADVRQRAMAYAVKAHSVLKCRGTTRVDLRYNPQASAQQDVFVLEVNTQPGMTPTSLLPDQALHAGMSFNDLVAWILDQARCDYS
jgi:D-alanine-D-alanine ligase